MEQNKKSINKKQILSDNCILIDKIGEGSFGDVYIGQNKNGKNIAIKIENKEQHKKSHLSMEYKIYKRIRKNGFIEGIPEVYSFIETENYNIMTMELLGESLSSIHEKFNKKFNLNTVLKLGIDLIDLMEKFHNTGFIHRDIKPNNFLIGLNSNNNKIYIMDLGLSKQYIINNKHIKLKTDKGLVGTSRYTSVNIHMGLEPSRRDELESIGYMLLYFLNGSLPWQGLKKNKTTDIIGEVKICTNLNKLCKGYPSCFLEYLLYCRTLAFDANPDYNKLKELFKKASIDNKIELKYCWI
jgi:serine/threonine protein kinase